MSDPLSWPYLGTSIHRAAEAIRLGGIVVVPTETSYGLAVDPDNTAAVERLFDLKRRDRGKPMLLLAASISQVRALVEGVPAPYEELMKNYWPGPLTLIFECAKYKNNPVSCYKKTIGLRISPHPLIQSLLQELGKPITATSANHSGEKVIQSAQQAAETFGESVSYILDGGYCNGAAFSTVIGYDNGRLVEYRAGKLKVL